MHTEEKHIIKQGSLNFISRNVKWTKRESRINEGLYTLNIVQAFNFT